MALIVCEGLDGCGKSTQISLLAERLKQEGLSVHCLREPGGTALGEQLRAVLLHPETEADPVAELLAYQTARAQLVRQVIQPALAAGDTVLRIAFGIRPLLIRPMALVLMKAWCAKPSMLQWGIARFVRNLLPH